MTTDHKEDRPPTVEERYASATHATNLRVHDDADRGSQADILMAMAWSPTRLGAALMRLHSEWEGAEHPMHPATDAVRRLAGTYQKDKDGMVSIDGHPPVLPMDAAKRQAHSWYIHELKILFGKLKTMPDVRHQLVMWASKNDIAEPEQRVAETLGWWLDHKCPGCNGLKKERIQNTPNLSHRDCKVCRGTGETKIPQQVGSDWYLADNKRLLKHIDVCVKTAQTSVRQRLRGLAPRKS